MHTATAVILIMLVLWIPAAITAVVLCGNRNKAARVISLAFYILLSIPWLLYSVVIIYTPWAEGGPDTRDWEENLFFVPIGIVMLLLQISTAAAIVIIKIRKRSRS